MKKEDFDKLNHTMQISLIMAIYIRNEMEDFHSAHLSDQQMQELNPIIRQAIYNILKCMKHASKETQDAEKTN